MAERTVSAQPLSGQSYLTDMAPCGNEISHPLSLQKAANGLASSPATSSAVAALSPESSSVTAAETAVHMCAASSLEEAYRQGRFLDDLASACKGCTLGAASMLGADRIRGRHMRSAGPALLKTGASCGRRIIACTNGSFSQ